MNTDAGPGPLPALQVFHIESSNVVCGGGHGDDTGAGVVSPRPLQFVQEEVCQQEVSQVVQTKVQLETLLGRSFGNQHDTGYKGQAI